MYCKFVIVSLILTCQVSSPAQDQLVLRKSPAGESRLLVLKSGRVLRGVMMPRPGGYEIVQAAGRVFVGSEQVHFLADDMRDAWQKLRDAQAELTPDAHLELARWCLTNKLNSLAKKELLDALHLDPYRVEAKRMLEGIVRLETAASRPAVSESEKIAARLKEVREHGALATERRSLGGLPEKLATDFTRRIQPLLSNKCGNARCHGPGRNDFVVLSTSRLVTPVRSEKNLASLLRQIDFEQPENSPVLKATVGLHGGSRKLAFPGRTGRMQLSNLRQWITATAQEIEPAARVSSRSGVSSTSGQVQLVSAEMPSDSTSGTERRHRSEQAKQFVREAVVATRYDDFDPDDFNRKVHGQSRSERTEARLASVPKLNSSGSGTYLNQTYSTETSRKESR